MLLGRQNAEIHECIKRVYSRRMTGISGTQRRMTPSILANLLVVVRVGPRESPLKRWRDLENRANPARGDSERRMEKMSHGRFRNPKPKTFSIFSPHGHSDAACVPGHKARRSAPWLPPHWMEAEATSATAHLQRPKSFASFVLSKQKHPQNA